MRGEVFEMLPFSESCSVPSLCVSTFSFSRAHPVLMFVACRVAKQLLVIVNNSLLLSIMIKRFVLKYLILLVDMPYKCEDKTLLGSITCAETQHRSSVMFLFHTVKYGNLYNGPFFHNFQILTMCSVWWKYASSMRWSSKNVWQKCSYARSVS